MCSGMLKHQDHRFPGLDRGEGLKIDFDKDPDAKRNKAYAKDVKERRQAALRELHATVPGQICYWDVSSLSQKAVIFVGS